MAKIVHTLYSGLGGHGNVVFSLLSGGFAKNHENHLVFFGVEPVFKDYKARAKKLGVQSYDILKKPRQYLKPLQEFKEILQQVKPEIIFIHSSELLYVALSYQKQESQTKVIYVEHESNATKSIILRHLSKKALKKASAVVCLTKNYGKELEKLFNVKRPIIIIPNGIDTDKFCPPAITPNGKKIGMAARMMKARDHKNLLIAFSKILKKHPDYELHLAGTGELSAELKSFTKELEINGDVKFLGNLNESEMIQFYQELTFYVQASHAETLSTSILQAMSSQLAVLASNIENNKALIQDGETGYLYKVGNGQDLYEKMLFMIEQPELCNRIGLNSRSHIVEHYSFRSMVEGYEAIVQAP